MAQIIQKTITITLSKLIKKDDIGTDINLDNEIVISLEELVKELVQDPTVIVEAEETTEE